VLLYQDQISYTGIQLEDTHTHTFALFLHYANFYAN